MESVVIRKAKFNDIPIVISLLYELDRPKPKKDSDVEIFRKLVKKYLKDSDKTILVAVSDNVEIIGLASIIFLSRLNQTNLEMYIPELVVSKKYQNKKIGTKLMNSCMNLAKEKKCHRIRLESGVQRKLSHEFYKKVGFRHSSHSFSLDLIQRKESLN